MLEGPRMKHLVLWLSLTACGGGLGGGGVGDHCRSSADCDEALDCAGADDAPVCGIAPREECSDDNGCSGGSVCHAIFDSCSADSIGSHCEVPCTGDPECGPDFVCDAGHCVAQQCDAGFACEDREVCDPGRIGATAPVFDRHHGCFAVACATDDECGARFCVNGTCQDAVGTCVEPMLVP